MSKQKRKFTSSFKRNAVKLSYDRETVSEVARELGLRPSLLHRRRRELKEYDENSFPGQGKPKQTDEQREISELKKKLCEAELERDILKKAVHIFSKSDRKNLGS